MKKILLALLLVSPFTMAGEYGGYVGELRNEKLFRVVDTQNNVVCYSFRYDTLTCVYVPPKPEPEQMPTGEIFKQGDTDVPKL